MGSRFHAVALVASPTYPNAVAWSDENLVAVASGHLVTILNPALPFGPKGLITIPSNKPFQIGLIERKDLVSGCMLPTCLSRDIRPSVRSISWSPWGFASNAGCLLAVCTTEGVVKVFRSPFCELSSEWVEVLSISEMLHTYFEKIKYGEGDVASSEEEDVGFITAEQYGCRNAMLSSVVVAWSPPMVDSKSLRRWCVLAIGAKSGTISFWRVHEPECYSITPGSKPPVATLIGLIQAHTCWVTAMTWSTFGSTNHLLLSTGSSDGSVKVWRGFADDLLGSTEDAHASFSLFKEVEDIGSGPVSVLALHTLPHQIILAVGKGSGSVHIWTFDTTNDQFHVFGPLYAHDQIVTGLAWAYDGRCLYSCSQDNSLRNWIIKGESLDEVSLPSNILGDDTSTNVPNVSDACFGLAVSPTSLVVAVVRRFDVNLLNPMYQARSQKAAVEFFWIGGQILHTDSDVRSDDPGFPNMDLVTWGKNILWCLHEYENLDKPMVLSDMISALSAFNKSEDKFVDQILVKWLMSTSYIGESVSNLTSRQLHLLNIISRHVKEHGFEEIKVVEKEVRERVVSCSFQARLKKGSWEAVGLAQMRQWVANNEQIVKDEVKVLVSKVDNFVTEEECGFCSEAVGFEDTEVGFCGGENKHKNARCGVCMVLCPTLSPTWFCVSCTRSVSNLAPHTVFNYPNGSADVILPKPFCPFCGILLQKMQPDFLLSATPV